MTAPDPADVIGQAAQVIHAADTENYGDGWDHRIARALHDAGLLADPADRGGSYGQPTYEDLRTACHLLGERLKRAESEVAELQAMRDRVRALAEGWHSRGEHDMEYSKEVPEDVRDARSTRRAWRWSKVPDLSVPRSMGRVGSMSDDDLRDKLTEAAARDMYQREGIYEQPGCPWDDLFDSEHWFWRDTVTPTIDALMPVVRDALAECHDAAVELTLDHAIRNDDGITLRLDKPNPWRVSD